MKNFSNYSKIFLCLFLIFSLAGCSAVLVPLSFNPERKLQQAQWLFETQNRPLPAESLIQEARQIYEKRRDEVGIAHTYRIYAFFLKSRAVSNWSGMKFSDNTINHDNRYSKAIEYLQKALRVYEKYNEYVYVSNVYFNMAALYHDIFNNNEMACVNLEKSLLNHIEYRKESPDVQLELISGYNSFIEIINKAKIEANCF